MSDKSKDNTGYNWQNYDKNGRLIQGNSKNYDDEHKWYNPNTGYSGYRGGNMTEDDKRESGNYFREQRGGKK